ncbi:hypothetical protein GCM10023074_37020 [Microbispora amethystogenes]|uniref:Lipoprotein n=1 Tax=Microbispora amethystogenes TaxID=1427754 RepID=A0ABQ4FBQ7_9ACTN|nr:hypothetical protein Mam01_24160 [Microbispora amethystogenes]
MPGAPLSARICPIAGALLLTLLAPVACSSEETPTAAEAGQTLRTHILQLLKERNAQDVTITDPGGKDIPCGDGRAKQTFAATGEDLPTRGSDALTDALLGALKRVAPYGLVTSGRPGEPMRVRNSASHTSLTLASSESGQYVVRGETECLTSH